MSTRDVLVEALEHLRAHGWTQAQLIDYETGAVCAMGAIAQAELVQFESDLVNRTIYTDRMDKEGMTRGEIAFRGTEEMRAQYELILAIREQYPEFAEAWDAEFPDALVGGAVPSWNDHWAKEPSEVEAVFEKAILKAEEQGL